jgi:hypothetical protein
MKHYAMKTSVTLEVEIHTFLTSSEVSGQLHGPTASRPAPTRKEAVWAGLEVVTKIKITDYYGNLTLVVQSICYYLY